MNGQRVLLASVNGMEVTMPRPNVPLAKEVVAIAKGLKAEGIVAGVIRCADGTEIEWGQSNDSEEGMTELEKWRAKKSAS